MKKLLPILYTLYSILHTFAALAKISAADVSLSISPPVVEILIAPNKKLTQTFILKLDGDNLTVTPELHLFKPSDNAGHVALDPLPLNPALIPLVVTSSLPLNTPHIVSGETISIALTFEAPTSDLPQDLYLALVVKTGAIEPIESDPTTSPGISSLILVTINPTSVLPINLEITDFETPHLHDSALPLELSPSLKNNADIMIRPEGKLEVFSPTGKTVFSTDLYPNLVLGNSSRTLYSIQDTLYSPLSWAPSWKNLGPHRVRLTIMTQGGTKLSEIEKTVWVLPIRATIIIFLGMLVLVIIWKNRSSSNVSD